MRKFTTKLLAIFCFVFVNNLNAQISGIVFLDVNGNGLRTTSNPIEPGVAGVIVNVYDTANILRGTATSIATGVYTITPTGTAPYRVEFVVPNTFVDLKESPGGANYSSSIQFVATNTQANVNFALVNEDYYSSTQDPRIAVPQHLPGNPLGGGTAGTLGSLKSMLYNSSGNSLSSLQSNGLGSQVGAIWGLAWDKFSAKLFSAAFVRRHSGLGPLGAGGIYVTNFATGTGVTSDLIDLSTVSGIDLGAVPTNAARGLSASATAQNIRDESVFGLVGKVGLGDIDIDFNQKKLYVVNLNERNVIVINIANYLNTGTLPTAADVTEMAITGMPTCTNGVARPFALKVFKDKLYIGITCTAENDAAAASAANMNMTVVSLDLVANTWATPVPTTTLNYTHGEPQVGGGTVNHPWSDATDAGAGRVSGNGWVVASQQYAAGANDFAYFSSRCSPWLTDIEFDIDGSMVLSTTDRAGFQWGGFQPHPNPAVPLANFMDFRTAGDILRFHNNNGTFVREVNGTTIAGGGCGLSSGFAEYYCGENFNGNAGHAENSGGALAFLPGSGEMAQTGMDVAADIWSNGIQKQNNTTGQKSGTSFNVYPAGNFGAASFAKSNGVGDIELLLDVSPIQIGNRIWNDVDGDGIQDAGENGIAGIGVSLVSPGPDGDYSTLADNQTWNTFTSTDGSYYFSTLNMVGADTRKPLSLAGMAAGILPGFDYRIQLTIPTGVLLTVSNASSNAIDKIDNDATQTGSLAIIPINTIATNHTYDIGLIYASLGNKVWRDDNGDGEQNANEPGVSGVPVSLFTNGLDNLPGTADDVLLITTLTDAFGNYLFNNLPAGDYHIKVTPPSNYKFTTQGSGSDSGTETDSDVNPIGVSKTITLSLGEKERNVDAGIILSPLPVPSSIGDRVWLDLDGDGVQDADEPGVSGVTVTLYDGGGNILSVTKTDANGNYVFTDLPNGTYSVGVSAPGGTVLTTSGGTTPGNNTDSDINPTTGKSAPIVIATGGTIITGIDAGIKNDSKAVLGDYVWNDVNRNGIQEATEQGIPNVVMELYATGPDNVLGGGDDILIGTTTTDALGYYVFPNLDPAKYFVVATPPAGYIVTLPNVVNTNGDVKDNDFVAGAAPYLTKYVSGIYDIPTTVGKIPRDMTVDLGMYRNVTVNTLNSISNFVWNDTDEDGVQDAGEPGVANVTVRLLDGTGTAVNSPSTGQPYVLTTDVNGLYNFIDLPDGNYIVEFDNIPAGYNLTGANTAPGVANNDATDSDADPVTGRTGIIALDPTSVTTTSVNNTTVDAGIKSTPAGAASLGDRVWYDVNNNGTQDATEAGVAGVTVELLDGTGTAVNVTGTSTPYIVTTNGVGEYIFTNLAAGTYQVRFSNFPLGFTSSVANAVVNNDVTDADANFAGASIATTTATTANYALANGEENLTVDMGIVPPVGRNSIGNYVWIDANADGLQGAIATEPGVKGVAVTLFSNGVDGAPGTIDDVVVTSTTTDVNGFYQFTGLPDGTYNVKFSNIPEGYSFTTKEVAATATGSDADKLTGGTNSILLDPTSVNAASVNNLDIDAGLVSIKAMLGDFVWLDANSNGLQDGTESPIAGVTVTLYDGTNTPIATAITDKTGKYLFTNLEPGTYTVGFTTYPPSLEFTTKEATPTATGSDVDPATGLTAPITLTAGQVNLNIDAGLKPKNPASVGDYVWIDVDRDGVQDVTEPGLPGVIATLYNAADSIIGTAVTDGNGLYRITNIPPATGYYIVFSNLPNGATFTTQTSNVLTTDATLGSDANVIGLVGKTASFPLVAGQYLPHVDAGVFIKVVPARLGNRVWRDDNKDGIQTAGEPGVAGIGVQLYRNGADQLANTTDDVFVGGTTTDAYGYYIFENLDSTVTTTAATTAQTSYNVKFTLPANYVFTTTVNRGDNADNTNSDASAVTGRTLGYILNPAESDTTADAGIIFVQPTTQNVGDRVWLDANQNGIQDPTESGVSGVVVTLFSSTGAALASTITDATGKYIFQNVAVGTGYTVGFTPPSGMVFTQNDQGGDDAQDSDADPVTSSPTFGKTPSFNVTAGNDNLTLDAGIYPQAITTASLGDKVWNDINKDGLQDANEPGVENVTVDLMDATGTTVLRTVKTDVFGNYMFNDLAAGTYVVRFALPTGFTRSPQNAGSNDYIDSDAATVDGKTAPIVLAAGDRNTTVDAGINRTASTALTPKLGDKVWYDNNNNGVQDAGEAGVPGVTAVLFTSANVAVDTTTTNASGNYLFTDLAANTYYVVFRNTPAGYTFTTRVNSADNQVNTNSDADSLGKTINVSLAANETDLTIDAGIITGSPSGKGSLGDRVWYDMNNNNIQDAGETGVNNVLVYLSKDVNRDGAFVGTAAEMFFDTTYTDASGNYLFTGLDSGYYQVRFLIPTGYTSVTQNVGTNDALDSDGPITGAGGTSVTATYALAQGEDNLTVDLGIRKTVTTNASLGNQVWLDANKDGIKDAGETGVPGVQATLYNSTTNAVLATTSTDKDGYYMFDNLAVGSYIVRFTNFPTGMYGTKQTTTVTNDRSAGDSLTGFTPVITLVASQNRTDVDFGLQTTRAALGDYVWIDANGDGVQAPTEKPVAGVTTTLYAADGTTVISSMITDGEGKYYYPNLAAGTYVVGFSTTPNGLNFTRRVMSADNQNNTNSDVDSLTSKTMLVALDSTEIDLTIDAGLYRPTASVGDYVWLDVDGDGKQDVGEPGVSGVIATLYNSANQVVGTAVTDGNGAYLITNVPAGTGYYVTFSNIPPNNVFTTQGNPTDTDNSKANPSTGTTNTFDLADGQQVSNIDAGLITPLAAIGNRVWRDDNKDGLQTAGEPGVAGISVTLYKNGTDQLAGTADDVLISTTVTDAYGKYIFNKLTPTDTTNATTTGQTSYNVKFGLPVNYTFTTQTGTADDQNDTNSDASVTTGNTTVGFKLAPKEIDSTVDAGLIFTELTTQCLGDKVWLDIAPTNGLQDVGEPGMAGVTVSLYFDANNDGDVADAGENIPYSTAITDADGKYQFCNIPVGNYVVGITNPSGFTNSVVNQGGGNQTLGIPTENNTDSDIDPVTVKTGIINLISGEILTNVDAGLVPTANTKASLGDKVWSDTNHDGIQNADEPGVPGVTVTLYDATGVTTVATTTTDVFGNYMFTNLTGSVAYKVGIITPSGYTISPKTQGADTTKDSNADIATGISDPIFLPNGVRELNVDFGIYKTTPAGTAKLGDVVWFDMNKNGTQDVSEPGVAGVAVTLYTNGVDALPGTIDDVLIESTATDVNGKYLFTELAANIYNVKFSNLPIGYSFTVSNNSGDNANNTNSDANPSTGNTMSYTLTTGEADLTVDAGLIAGSPVGKGTLGNKVWYDVNNNGLQDGANETGVSNVTVTLQKDINNDGDFVDAGEANFATQTTNALGEYLFAGLDAGVYKVQFSNLPAGYQTSTSNVPTNDDVDSDGEAPISGVSTTASYTLAQGEDNLSVDLGINKTSAINGSISDKVFFDTNNNGIRDANEPGITGVTVTLYNASGIPIVVTTTDINGNYLFDNLTPSNYTVGFSNFPSGLIPTNNNTTITNDNSSGDTFTGLTPTITLGSAQNRTDVDFGLRSVRATLGNYVWIDSNGDGIQDPTEKGVPGVTVSLLYDANNDGDVADAGEDVPVTSMITNQNGEYLFTNLLPGNYQVMFSTTPSGLSYTKQNTPGDNNDNTNSDFNLLGASGIYNLTAGEVDLTVDGGLYKPTASVGNYVWYDNVTHNGIQDATETGVGGVLVKLINAGPDNNIGGGDDVNISATVTGSNGEYLFSNVAPGTYFVSFSNTPGSLAFTFIDQGTDVLDSDVDIMSGNTPIFVVPNATVNLSLDAGIFGTLVSLPVKYLSFTASKQNNTSVLNFTIAQAAPTSTFVIERSVTGANYVAIGTVLGTNATNYMYTDLLPNLNAKNYYRIKEIDAAGNITYSEIRFVRFTKDIKIDIYPIPANKDFNVNINGVNGKISMQLVNANGQVVMQKVLQVGNNSITTNTIASGLYIVVIKSDNNIIEQRRVSIVH